MPDDSAMLAIPSRSHLALGTWERELIPALYSGDPEPEQLLGLDEAMMKRARAAAGDEDEPEWWRCVAVVRRRLGEQIADGRPGRSGKTLNGINVLAGDRRAARSNMMAVARPPMDEYVAWLRREHRWSKLVSRARKWWAEQNPVTDDMPQVGDESGDGWQMLYGDMRQRLTEIPDGSIDLIFTDPPYPKDYLHLYGDLAEHATRLLKPRGFLITYAGLIFLPEVIDLLRADGGGYREGLTYGWTFCLLMDEGSQSRIMGRHVIQGWKPLIVMTKGQWRSGEWLNDPIRHARMKDRYEWQQDTEAAAAVIERFSNPNGVVLDPFMGTGTTAVAALGVGRRVIGVEADAARFAESVARLR